MPHTSTAWKRLRQSEKRRLHNRTVKKAIRTQIKKVEAAVEGGNAEQVQKELVAATKKLDKAAAKRIIHANLAARKKSQLARLVTAKKPPAS